MESIKKLTERLEAAKRQEREAIENAKYPTGLVIDLKTPEGNAFFILAQCQQLGRRFGLTKSEIKTFTTEATSNGYDNLKNTCQKWFGIMFIE